MRASKFIYVKQEGGRVAIAERLKNSPDGAPRYSVAVVEEGCDYVKKETVSTFLSEKQLLNQLLKKRKGKVKPATIADPYGAAGDYYVGCPLCKKSVYTPMWQGLEKIEEYRAEKCRSCGAIFDWIDWEKEEK